MGAWSAIDMHQKCDIAGRENVTTNFSSCVGTCKHIHIQDGWLPYQRTVRWTLVYSCMAMAPQTPTRSPLQCVACQLHFWVSLSFQQVDGEHLGMHEPVKLVCRTVWIFLVRNALTFLSRWWATTRALGMATELRCSAYLARQLQ